MPIATGSHTLGSDDATLTVRTGRTGAAAKAGHDLVIEVTSWSATLDLADDPRQTTLVLTADPASLRVREGTGGIQALGDDDKAGIEQTIDDEVLKGATIAFRSSAVDVGPDGLSVQGELELAGHRHPLAFDLTAGADGRLSGRAVVVQSDWGIKPYSALFGTLKVTDAVEVVVDAKLPTS
jgi:polyisoprenoid-binding protein YceI